MTPDGGVTSVVGGVGEVGVDDGETARFADPATLSCVAVMVAEPVETAVTRPASVTVATAVFDVDQTTSATGDA